MRMLSKIFDYFIGTLMWIAGILCILVMLGVSADVVGRYFLKSPILGMDDAAQIIILYIVFLGSAWVLKVRGHINMDVVLQLIGLKSQYLVEYDYFLRSGSDLLWAFLVRRPGYDRPISQRHCRNHQYHY